MTILFLKRFYQNCEQFSVIEFSNISRGDGELARNGGHVTGKRPPPSSGTPPREENLPHPAGGYPAPLSDGKGNYYPTGSAGPPPSHTVKGNETRRASTAWVIFQL